MSVIITPNGNIGPFKSIKTLQDRLRADNTDYPFIVIGAYSISEDDSLAPVPPAPPATVPESITPLQGLQAIDLFGMGAAYEAWENDPARTLSEKAFIRYATAWRRDDPVLIAGATSMGLTGEQIDQMFIVGDTL